MVKFSSALRGGAAPGGLMVPSAFCSHSNLQLAETDLARSGLSLEAALSNGIFPVDNAASVNPDFAPSPAIVIPYFDIEGKVLTYQRGGMAAPFCRARYLHRPGWPTPKGRKYDQPRDSGTPPFFPKCFDWHIASAQGLQALALVEGEKKAIALCLAGIPAIAIGGVFNFGDGSSGLHPALAVITASRDVYVVFDSDAATKPEIQVAEWRLTGQLALNGARPHLVRLPMDGAEKVGADDYLMKHGTASLTALILSTPVLGAATAQFADTTISVSDILKRHVSPVEELIPGLVEKGVANFLAGPGGVHKSRLAMQWGLCLNVGRSIWALDAALDDLRKPKASLVYYSAEDGANELARRAQAISASLKLGFPKQGIFFDRRAKDSALVVMGENGKAEIRPFYHEMLSLLQAIPGHKVVVLDSAYDFVRFAGRAKIDEDAVNYFIKVILQGLCDLTDSTLLIPWHPSQAGSERADMGGWSVAWTNAPRARLALTAAREPDTYELSVTKRNHGPKGQSIKLKFHEGALIPVAAMPDDGKSEAFCKSVVMAAIEAARLKVPLNRRDRFPEPVVKSAEEALGRRPKKDEIKDKLEEAVRSGDLIYLVGTRHRAAGYYPPDSDIARDLALAAKRAE